MTIKYFFVISIIFEIFSNFGMEFFLDIVFSSNIICKNVIFEIFFIKNFCSKIFLPKIFLVKIFDKYFYCENIFGLLLLIAPPLVPYLKPQPLLSPSSGIFEVKCDRRNELTDRTDAMIVPFIYLDLC